jgi:CHAT domain-containing protein
MEKYLTGINTLCFSPDGLLHQLSFAAIPVADGRLLIDRYKLVQLTSTRQLVVPDEAPGTVTSAALFGGIDYNHQNADTATAPTADAFAYVYQQNHRNLADSFAALPNTLQEIDGITASLQAVHAGIYRYTGAVASESNFRTLCNTAQPSVIHFATHGFTLPDTMLYSRLRNAFSASNNPLLRTGLVLAAGNQGWKSRNVLNEDDGVLTGLEIAAMQLQHTQLVVLSACETANGEVRGSEGVFGLQRAFKMTGVNYVLATLWQVPDAETKTFMTQFYQHWLPGHTIQDAFYRTQHYFRQRKLSPYYWAGFVLIK